MSFVPGSSRPATRHVDDTFWSRNWRKLKTKQTYILRLKTESSQELAQAARDQGNAVNGAILFAQKKLNCTRCHATGQQNLLGPDLRDMAQGTTDASLVESILKPSQVIKKGFETFKVTTLDGKTYNGRIVEQDERQIVLRDSDEGGGLVTIDRDDIDELFPSQLSSMPDGLAEQLDNRQQLLDLVRYMMQLADAGPTSVAKIDQGRENGGSISVELRGLVWLHQFNCTACHRSDSQPGGLATMPAPNLAWIVGRVNPEYIEHFIASPSQVKPSTAMPDLMSRLDTDARNQAAKAITQYLISLSPREFTQQSLDPSSASRGRELFHAVGCVACHSPRNADGVEQLAESSVPLGDLRQKFNLDGLAALLEDPLAVRPAGRMPNMRLTHWESLDIANYLLQGPRVSRPVPASYEMDPRLVEQGRQLFRELRCQQCHTTSGEPTAIVVREDASIPRLSQVHTDGFRGCLSNQSGEWPRFQLDDSQRQAILAALQRSSTSLTNRERIDLTLTSFNCLACHQRGDLGGVPPERDAYFKTSDQNLGPQGRLPPPLTGVGAKLNATWLREVLIGGRTIRPYILTRMPQYGTENVEPLVSLFAQVDPLPEVTFASFADQELMKKAGHELAGSGGLNCVACHTFQQKPAQTMQACDLTEMAPRLQKEWFYDYLREPQRRSPNTVMPSFWPGGHAMRKEILDGDADLQIEALWQYLLDERQARVPQGLVNEPIELLATDEAVMLRRSYNGIGKRGIGVGYPGRVNLAFDAEQMRWGMIWKGKFADPAGVWTGQGSGMVRPLGNDLVRFPSGPELDDATQPWVLDYPEEIAKQEQPQAKDVNIRPPHHHFKGYYLDALQRPTFMYQFDNVDVEDYAVDLYDSETHEAFIRRTLTFRSSTGRDGTAFRLASDANIVPESSRSFLIGKSLRIRIDDQHSGEIIESSAGPQLRVKMDLPSGTSKLVLEYRW